jgi:hypothetical protein
MKVHLAEVSVLFFKNLKFTPVKSLVFTGIKITFKDTLYNPLYGNGNIRSDVI